MRIKNTVIRQGWYHFRLSVPADLRGRIGKNEITRSLDTREPHEAKHLARQLTEEWKLVFDGMRGNTDVLTEADIDEKIQAFRAKLRKRLDESIRETLSSHTDSQLETFMDVGLSDEIDDARTGQYSYVKCAGLLDDGRNLREELQLWDYDQRLKRRVVLVVLEILVAYYHAIREELGLMVDHPIDLSHYRSPVVSEKSATKKGENPVADTHSSESLTDILGEMLKVKDRAIRTRTGLQSDLQLFVDYFRREDVKSFNIGDILKFRDECLVNLPSNASKKFPNANIKELLAMDESVVRLGETTVNNRMRSIRAVFAYAHKTGRISIDPCVTVTTYVKPKGDRKEATEKVEKVFTDDEVQTIIKEALTSDYKRFPSRRWATLLIVNLGMRTNECLQLRTCDIDIDAGTLDIVAQHSTQSLKNKVSERYLPLPRVIMEDKAFVTYVRERKAEGTDIPLWANTAYSKSNGYRRAWSRWFNGLDVVSGGRNAHSLRHTAITRARQLKLPIEDVQRIVGHTTGGSSIHEAYVDKQAMREALRETVNAMAVTA
jgi:integrase